jgi:membrane protease YdiL (CAAX protease family)
VPWGGKETVGGMAAWAGSFVGVGLLSLPLLAALAGPAGFASLSQQDKALFALGNQIVETAVGLGVIALVVRRFEPLPPDVLKYSLAGPFRKPDGWLAWGLLGVLCSPLVVYAASVGVDALGADNTGGRGTADAVSQILSLDGSTFAALFITTAILAPVLEETVFRGFLLPSLTKFMPTPAAVVLSSLAFGLVHLSPRDFPQLTALGVLLGFVYVRSRNLAAPILIHGAWNGTVLSLLYALKASGVDLNQVLHGGL